MRACLCPVCQGSGKLYKEFNPDTSVYDTDVTCHGCGGRGWVMVSEGNWDKETLETNIKRLVGRGRMKLQPSSLWMED